MKKKEGKLDVFLTYNFFYPVNCRIFVLSNLKTIKMNTEKTTTEKSETSAKETISNINTKLGSVLTIEQEDEMYSAQYEEHLRRVQESGCPNWVAEMYG